MLLYFRLFLVFFTAHFRPKIQIGDSATRVFRVFPTDTEYFISMNAARFQSLSELSQLENNIRSGVFLAILWKKWWPVVTGHITYYKRPLRLFQKFKATSKILGWNERDFVWENRIHDFKGNLCAISYTRGPVKSRKGIVPTSEVLRAIQAPEEMKVVDPHILRLFDLNHVTGALEGLRPL